VIKRCDDCGEDHEFTWADERFGYHRAQDMIGSPPRRTRAAIKTNFKPGYKSGLARFPNDKEAYVESDYQWKKLIDKRKRQGWVQRDWSDLHTASGRLIPKHLRGKRRKPLLGP